MLVLGSLTSFYMENHPIPQDVTGFQFKLIGDMTVKQFAYLAAGVIAGWIFFSLPLPVFLRIPLAILLVLLGVILAFLPISGRPADVMLANFIRAVFSPTQFIYQKTNSDLLFPKPFYNFNLKAKKNSQKSALQNARQKIFLQQVKRSKMPKTKLDEKETAFFNSVLGLTPNTDNFQKNQDASSSPHIISMDTQEEVNQKNKEKITSPQETAETYGKKALLLEKELENAKKEDQVLQKEPSPSSTMQHQKVLELEKELQDILAQKEKLTQQLLSLSQKLDMQKQSIYTPTTASPRQETKNVRHIPKALGKSVGLPTTPDIPNLLVGIVKNPREQPLPNILIEVKDSEGNAVRAFKTNGIGRFASATPLINGLYTITFEDTAGQNKFDSIELAVNGEIILPLEVISVDTREELRRSLFNQNA